MTIDDDIVSAACSVLLIYCASAHTLLNNKRKHTVWMKRYLQDRTKFGVFNTLLPELATNDLHRWLQYIRMDVRTFEELFSKLEPTISRKKTKFRLASLNHYV